MVRILGVVGILSTAACDEAAVGTDDSDAERVSTWSGRVDGHVAFEPDWEIIPYCSGLAQTQVDGAGAMSLTATCDILWGPYRGVQFDVVGSGELSDAGEARLDLVFSTDPDERDFEDATVTGAIGEQGELILQGDSRYTSQVAGGLDEEAFVVVRLTPDPPAESRTGVSE